MKPALGLLFVCLVSAGLGASSGPPVDIRTRAQGAERVVIATIVDVHSSFGKTVYGDQIIVSRVLLQVEETMKGAAADRLDLDVEGGTVGDLTLHVSDMPSVEPGERAVFFLERLPSGVHVPHRRGLGILKLDSNDHVRGTSLTVDAIRGTVRDVVRQPGR